MMWVKAKLRAFETPVRVDSGVRDLCSNDSVLPSAELF